MLSKLAREFLAYVEFLVNGAPGKVGYTLRRWFFGRRLGGLARGARLGAGLLIYGPREITIGRDFSCWRQCALVALEGGRIELGDRVSFSSNVNINAAIGGRIALGNDVLVGPNVVMRSSDHRFASLDEPINKQGHTSDQIIIEDDVWVAANAVVVGGVRVGRGSVVAAGAVVTTDVAPYTVVGGVPARLLKTRDGDSRARGGNDVAYE